MVRHIIIWSHISSSTSTKTSADELGTMSKNNLRGITLGPKHIFSHPLFSLALDQLWNSHNLGIPLMNSNSFVIYFQQNNNLLYGLCLFKY